VRKVGGSKERKMRIVQNLTVNKVSKREVQNTNGETFINVCVCTACAEMIHMREIQDGTQGQEVGGGKAHACFKFFPHRNYCTISPDCSFSP
jgi:hypothetical protein